MPENFEIDWNNDRDMATARLQVGDMEVVAHCHMATVTRTGTDSLGFIRNSGREDHPYMDMGVHLPAGGYRRLAQMLTALADAADAEVVARATAPLPLGEKPPTICPLCDSSRIRTVGFARWFCDSCSGSFPGAMPAATEEAAPNTFATDVPCPDCGALPGVQCTGSDGREAAPHGERQRLLERTQDPRYTCANCEGGGCNDCLPEPHDAESEDAPNI